MMIFFQSWQIGGFDIHDNCRALIDKFSRNDYISDWIGVTTKYLIINEFSLEITYRMMFE